ncbi:sensor histidine kinase [Dinghuibacter silviterrae]|uniref:histidine kinase n=1 Tax=Dinghuibacter silviterrae TaxID=1539049 RepID=A0A4R8DGU0_9BACT|nr:HAMP domain-containing sensor histidine kinase [Dinghuibacter silviterrae]TDW96901.1 signal transduction histidine kinase [Dinghuibacter silviterrae]
MKKIRSLVYVGTGGLKEYDPQKAICIGINAITLVNATLCLGVGGFYSLITQNMLMLGGVIVETGLLTVPILLNHRHRHSAAALFIFLTFCCTTLYYGCIIGRILNADLMLVYLISSALFVFKDLKTKMLCVALVLLLIILLEYNYSYQVIKPIPFTSGIALCIRWSANAVIIFLVIITFAMYSKRYNHVLKELRAHAQKVEEDLIEETIAGEEKVKFISSACHEVNNFFTGQFSLIRQLDRLERDNRHADIKELLGIVKSASNDLQLLINNVLSWSYLELGLKNDLFIERVDIKALFINLVRTTDLIALEKNTSITLVVDESLPQYITTDRLKLLQISHNLISNAIKHANGNSILLQLECLPGRSWRIVVQDKGVGISESLISKIFNPFVTEKSTGNQNGIGIGLYITRELVHKLRGDIHVDSKVDLGARFIVTLPELVTN